MTSATPFPVRPAAPQRGTALVVLAALVLTAIACSRRESSSGSAGSGGAAAGTAGTSGTTGGTIVLYDAGSLARPLRAALDSFAAGEHVTVQQENAGSLETARKLTDLHKIPDIVALADYEVFPELLMPGQTTWYVQFARNRMVLAFTDKSKFAADVDSANWYRILQRPGVEVGRSDPNLDPNGYRTLITMHLAASHYHQPHLYQALLAAAPTRNVRPKEVDLVGLLQAGELDYIWSYQSVAEAAGLDYIPLPSAIDLSDPAQTSAYARASVTVRGKKPGTKMRVVGQPIVYGISIPTHAPHMDIAERFMAYLLSPEGKAALRAMKLDVLDHPVLIGNGAPPAVTSATTPGEAPAASP